MITGIYLKNVASYDATGQNMENLKSVNFIFGANGSGKTTISRVLANESDYPDCSVNWDGAPLEKRIYNQDFVEANFHEDNEFKGIFTLGKESSELVQEIASAKEAVDSLDEDIAQLKKSLGGADGHPGKIGERDELAEEFIESAWNYKKRYENIFRHALKGTMGRKVDFAARVREEARNKSTELRTLEELKERAASIYSDDLVELELLTLPETEAIIESESAPLLAKKIVGKDDVDIAAMIRKLQNSDWVRQGLKFFSSNDNVCPFCQQETSAQFAKSLKEYFDETYLADLDSLKMFLGSYRKRAVDIKERLELIIQSESTFIDFAIFQPKCELLTEKVETNLNAIEQKLRQPSTIVKLESLQTVLQEVVTQIESANKKIQEHNALVINSNEEQRVLQKEIWRFIVEDANAIIESHEQKIHGIENAIEGLTTQLEEKEKARVDATENLNKLEKRGTSIQSAAVDINKTLENFNFRGFSLAVSENPGYYKIVRPNGEDAHRNLSEGEKTFITFLYFFHWLKGSQSQSGVMANRVAVFDDPVSSLDSEVMFIVSTLIKSVIKSIAEGNMIKQIFLLTHNLYFFKEVSFTSNKQNRTLNNQPRIKFSYWTVTKRNELSQIERHENNPIKSAYQMLWDEVKREDCSRHTIRNTLRRILEYYFSTIGGQALEDLPTYFSGNEQSICRSLISWIHEGSHFTDDDYTVVPSIETVDRQKAVFKSIFEKTNHMSHYNMMMGENDV